MLEGDLFDRANLKFHVTACFEEHNGSDRKGSGDANEQALNVVIVPNPATLEVGELDFAVGDIGEDIGERSFGAIEGGHDAAVVLRLVLAGLVFVSRSTNSVNRRIAHIYQTNSYSGSDKSNAMLKAWFNCLIESLLKLPLSFNNLLLANTLT